MPDASTTRNIGSSSQKWNSASIYTLYVTEIVGADQPQYQNITINKAHINFLSPETTNSDIQIETNLAPDADGTRTLGTSSVDFSNIYSKRITVDNIIGGDIQLLCNLIPDSSGTRTLGSQSSDFSNIYSERVTVGTTVISSDDRLKHNEKDISNALNVIKLLKPQSYDMTHKLYDASYSGEISENYKHMSGFIAQEVREINDISYCCIGKEFDQSGNPTRLALDYNSIFTYGIAGIKELHNMVENLKDENKLLKNKLNEVLTELGKDTI